MKTVLITGGAGFVGSHIALGLRKSKPDTKVIVLDNLKRRGSELNLPRIKDAGIAFVHGDIRNPEDIESVGPIDLLMECSAEPSVLAGYDSSPMYVVNTNLTGTIHCLEWARKCAAPMIFLSTSRIYPMHILRSLSYHEAETRFVLDERQHVSGVSSRGISEDFPVYGARSMYGATKFASEVIIQEYMDMYGLRGIINRCGVIAGPWQMGKVDQGIVTFWVARHVFGGKLNYISYGGKGKQVRDILHADDLLELLLYQMDHLDELNGQIFNVGGGLDVSVSLRELTDLCAKLTGAHLEIGSIPEDRLGDVPLYLSDCSRIKQATGWKPKRSVETILEDTSRWMKDHEAQLRPILG